MADRNKKAEAAIKNFGEDLEGRTALYPAAASGSSIAEQTTLALIDQGADAGIRHHDGKTALHYAARSTSFHADETVRALLDRGVDVAGKDNESKTALHYAAASTSYNTERTVCELLKKGADVASKDKDSKTALHYAAASAFENTERIVYALLENRADVAATDNDGKTALHYAAASMSLSTEKTVCALIENGADVAAKDKDGKTALHYAAASASYFAEKTVCALLEKGADVASKDKDSKTALHYAATSTFYNAERTVYALLENRADVAATDNDGKTALDYAAVSKSSSAGKLVDTLLERKADVVAKGNDGKTALHYAAASGFDNAERTVYALLENRADVAATDNNGKTALHYAAASGFDNAERTVYALLKNRADVAATDNYGKTALHYAAAVPNVNVILVLIAKGASVTLKDNDRNTPLDQANGILFEKFNSELRNTITGILKRHRIAWLTLDLLPLFTLSSFSNAILDIGLNASAEGSESLPHAKRDITDVISKTSLKGIGTISVSHPELFLNTGISSAKSVSLVDCHGATKSKGTLGGVLGMKPDGTYIALTCCHVISMPKANGDSGTHPQLFSISLGSDDGEPGTSLSHRSTAVCVNRSVHFPWDKGHDEIVDWALIEFKTTEDKPLGNVCSSQMNIVSRLEMLIIRQEVNQGLWKTNKPAFGQLVSRHGVVSLQTTGRIGQTWLNVLSIAKLYPQPRWSHAGNQDDHFSVWHITRECGEPFTKPGDSGAWVWNERPELVGMIFGMHKSPKKPARSLFTSWEAIESCTKSHLNVQTMEWYVEQREKGSTCDCTRGN